MHRQFILFFVCALSIGIVTPAFGITLGQSDDFNDGTTQGWTSGLNNPNPPVNLADVGQAGVGDHVLHVTSNGQIFGPGAKPTFFNSTQWTGDYLAAGVNAISFDINNLSGIAIHPGLELFGPGGNIFTLNGPTIPANSGWMNVTISLDTSNLFGANVSATLAGVTELRFREIQGGLFVTPSAATSAYYDNITAVPEPAAVVIFGLAALGVGYRRV